MKNVLTEYFHVILVAFITVFIIGVVALSVQVSDNNAFASVASDVVSRHGGLTDDAVEEINHYSQKMYNGRYTVQTTTGTKETYGTTVSFTVLGKMRLFYFNIPADIPFTVTSVTKMR